jgi:hypothetical protein
MNFLALRARTRSAILFAPLGAEERRKGVRSMGTEHKRKTFFDGTKLPVVGAHFDTTTNCMELLFLVEICSLEH